MRRILLTGSDGFVGRILQRYAPCVPFMDDGDFVDLRDAPRVARVVANIHPDAVIHLAAQSFVPASFADPPETFAINFLGTLNLLRALQQMDFTGRLLFVGSGDVYGLVPPEDLPVTEDRTPKPRNPYSVSKVAAEALCYQWSQTEPFDVVMTRSFNHIGPGQSERFVVSDMARQVIEIKNGRREPILRTGDVDVTRDFTDARDVVQAYLLLLSKGRSGEVYNVCSGVERSIRSLLLRMLELENVKACIEQEASRLRRVEQRRMCGSSRKLQLDTGWKPAIATDTSLIDVLSDWETRAS